jgi:hypothetical protein
MSRITALIAATAALVLTAAPVVALADEDDEEDEGGFPGFYLGWAPPVYYDYGPTYYYGRHYWRPHYRTYYRRYAVYPRYAAYRYRYRGFGCAWHTRRYYERNGDYVVRHERTCR